MEKSSLKTQRTSSKPATDGQLRSNGNRNPNALQNKNPEKLDAFLLDTIKDIYWAEKHLVKALSKLQKAATTQELKDAFADHAEETEEQVARLEQVFEKLGKKAQGKKCEAMEGLTKEAETIIEETEAGSLTRDVALIMAAQKVEHYEIATYGGLAQLAKTMGLNEIAQLFVQTLQEEKEADELLTSIAEEHINLEAAGERGSNYNEEEEE